MILKVLAVKRDKNSDWWGSSGQWRASKVTWLFGWLPFEKVSSLTNLHREDMKDLLYSDSLSPNFWPLQTSEHIIVLKNVGRGVLLFQALDSDGSIHNNISIKERSPAFSEQFYRCCQKLASDKTMFTYIYLCMSPNSEFTQAATSNLMTSRHT